MKKKYKYTKSEEVINKVLTHLKKQSMQIDFQTNCLDESILESEKLLTSFGYSNRIRELKTQSNSDCIMPSNSSITIPSWEELFAEANKAIKGDCTLTSLFTSEELRNNELYITRLNEEYNALHRLDKWDYIISGIGALVGSILDIALIGIPKPTTDGLKAGQLSNYIREYLDKKLPADKIKALERKAKVSYDAQDNRNTKIYVSGLSTYYHRLLALGHDPILGFIVGVFDIMNGRMTTIDKNGKIISQVMENYASRKESDIFSAISKQFLHLLSDINTSMGLPAPLMGLFNLLQVGSIGDEKQTVAEIVQGMYYEGYDFVHFCSMSIPVMVTEVIVRILYFIKRRNEGATVKQALPLSTDHTRNPKLGTMLFIAHSGTVAINAGKVYFTKNPMAINSAQWMAFARYSYLQLKWSLIQKPQLRNKYVMQKLDSQTFELVENINSEYDSFTCQCYF